LFSHENAFYHRNKISPLPILEIAFYHTLLSLAVFYHIPFTDNGIALLVLETAFHLVQSGNSVSSLLNLVTAFALFSLETAFHHAQPANSSLPLSSPETARFRPNKTIR
jgi:hypothetical protein